MTVVAGSTAKLIPVARPYLGAEEEVAVVEALRSGWITQGPRVAEFEQRFSRYIRCPHAIAVSSCTTALHLALLACGIQSGDEVICPSLSFIATANSIRYVGATPIFVDVDQDTFNIDPDRVAESITDRTKAILVVHQVGLPADMDRLMKIAEKHRLPVIEDAACAIGSTYNGDLIGRPIGTMACFSFHPRKILTTGEGGMITVRDSELAERLRRLRQHSMSLSDVARHSVTKITHETYDEVGYNFRMTDMQAAIGLVQLNRLEGFLAKRRLFAGRYDEALRSLSWLQTPVVPANSVHNYQSYMVRVLGGSRSKRDEIMQELLEQGVSTRRAIMAIHREAPYQAAARDAELPNTNMVTDSGLILPLYHEMSEAEQDHVIDALHGIRM
jgi:perosamine synthetase